MLYGDYTIRGYYTMENVFLPLFPGRFLQAGIKLQGRGGKVAKNEADSRILPEKRGFAVFTKLKQLWVSCNFSH